MTLNWILKANEYAILDWKLHKIASFGYGVYSLPDGHIVIADPQDGPDGFGVICKTLSEAYGEWWDTVQPYTLEAEDEMERARR
jgi:hypothetical protein